MLLKKSCGLLRQSITSVSVPDQAQHPVCWPREKRQLQSFSTASARSCPSIRTPDMLPDESQTTWLNELMIGMPQRWALAIQSHAGHVPERNAAGYVPAA
jgi:hypothetical protein